MAAIPVVLLKLDDYKTLLHRAICAPKNCPALSGKQKRKFNDAMETAAILEMRMETVSHQPQCVQEVIENGGGVPQ